MNEEHGPSTKPGIGSEQPGFPITKTSEAGERLQKVLASAGFGSRRSCEELILAGRVSIDNKVITELGTKVDPANQQIYVDSERIKLERKRYFLLCKPKNVVCTAFDPANRTKAVDLVPRDFGRLFTVGRLDENSEGLLLVTNDGELAERLAHPRYQVERRYRVLVAGHPTGKILDELKQGLYFTEGKFRVRDVRRIGAKGQSTILEVTLTEGQNREIRRLFSRVGHKVMALMRVAFGPLVLGNLEPGEFRELSHHEVTALQEFAAGKRTSGVRPPRANVAAGKGRETGKKIGGVKRPAPSKTIAGVGRPAPNKVKDGGARRPVTSKKAVSKRATRRGPKHG